MILPILALIVTLRLTTAAPSLILQSSESSLVDAFKALNAPEAPHGILNLSSYTVRSSFHTISIEFHPN